MIHCPIIKKAPFLFLLLVVVVRQFINRLIGRGETEEGQAGHVAEGAHCARAAGTDQGQAAVCQAGAGGKGGDSEEKRSRGGPTATLQLAVQPGLGTRLTTSKAARKTAPRPPPLPTPQNATNFAL